MLQSTPLFHNTCDPFTVSPIGKEGQGRAARAELNHPLDQKVITIGDHRRPHMVSDGCAVYYIKLILDHFGSTIFLNWHIKGIPNSQYHNGTSMQYHLTTIGDHVSTNGDHLTTWYGSQMVSVGNACLGGYLAFYWLYATRIISMQSFSGIP